MGDMRRYLERGTLRFPMKTTPKTFSQSSLKAINGTTEIPTSMKVKTSVCVGRDYLSEPGKIEHPNLR